MSFTAGSLVRFSAIFRRDGKSVDCAVVARVSDSAGDRQVPVHRAGAGVYYCEVRVRAGAMTVRFDGSVGAGSETTYLVTPAVGRPAVSPLGRIDRPTDWERHYRDIAGKK